MSELIKVYEINKIKEDESIFNDDGSLTVTLHLDDKMREFVNEMVFSESDRRIRRRGFERYFDKSTWLLRIIRDLYENKDAKYTPNPISIETVEMIRESIGQNINMGFNELRCDLGEQLNNIENILRCFVDEYDEE